jgi:hypothetical protein
VGYLTGEEKPFGETSVQKQLCNIFNINGEYKTFSELPGAKIFVRAAYLEEFADIEENQFKKILSLIEKFQEDYFSIKDTDWDDRKISVKKLLDEYHETVINI